MRQQSLVLFLALAVVLLFATATRAEKQPTITRLEMRDRIVTVTAGSNELLYSVKGKDGKVLDANLNEAQLEAKHPELYRQVRPAIAQPETNPEKGEVLWFSAPSP